MSDKPLWMPEGSVRAVIALSIVGGALFAAFQGYGAADALTPLAGAVTVYYFEKRANGN